MELWGGRVPTPGSPPQACFRLVPQERGDVSSCPPSSVGRGESGPYQAGPGHGRFSPGRCSGLFLLPCLHSFQSGALADAVPVGALHVLHNDAKAESWGSEVGLPSSRPSLAQQTGLLSPLLPTCKWSRDTTGPAFGVVVRITVFVFKIYVCIERVT